MTPEQMRDRAIELFKKRFHCSQAVLAAGQEMMGTVNDDVIKAMGLFGGGMSGSCRVCGALSGGIALISSLFSRADFESKEDPMMWRLGNRLISTFEKLTEEHGGTDCRDIARMNWRDTERVKEFYSDPDSRRKICVQLVGDTAYALGKMLEEEVIKKK